MTRSILFAVPLLMAGCTTMAEPRQPTGPCRVDDALRMRFVGAKFRMAMRDEIGGAANAPIVRVLRPDDMTTREFNEYRLSIRIDDTRRIEGLICG